MPLSSSSGMAASSSPNFHRSPPPIFPSVSVTTLTIPAPFETYCCISLALPPEQISCCRNKSHVDVTIEHAPKPVSNLNRAIKIIERII
ncbi:hypothetical protein P8452_61642 [Trifolium repens]|nr:hypothetical protein P8452_61642 [Trifolium repens]